MITNPRFRDLEKKKRRLRDRNKCTLNESSRLFANAVEISRLDENFARPKILEVPFAIPLIRSFLLMLEMNLHQGSLKVTPLQNENKQEAVSSLYSGHI